MDKRLDQLVILLKTYLGLIVSISLGVFLFVLFFQPFLLDKFDFNNRLLFFAGLGAIVFLLLLLRTLFLWRVQINRQASHELIIPSYIGDFALVALNSAAFAFYLRFVGEATITFYSMFKVVLISLAPVVILRISEAFRELRYRNESIVKHQIGLQRQLEKYEEDFLSKYIEIVSEQQNEKVKLQIADIAFIRSADNYVEIFHREGSDFRKELIRSTLKGVEQQIKPYSNFVRCHRTCIVNTHFVKKLNKNFNNYWLSLNDIDEKLPVSRQYLLQIKDIL